MKIVKLSIFLLSLLFISCATNKKLYESREYDKIISRLCDKAQRNSLDESQIETLANSYHQANQDDFTKIMELKKSGQPDIWTEIFYTTSDINNRQKKVDNLSDEIKEAINYKRLSLENELKNAKTKAEAFLSAKAKYLLNNPEETNIKEAEVLINKLQRLNSQNKNIADLRLHLVVSKASRIIFRIATPIDLNMPNDFAQIALDFDDNSIFGVPFDVVPNDNMNYDLMICISINEKRITPERVDAVTFEERKGDKVAKVTDKTMSKTATIIGEIEFIDVKNNNILIRTPFDISSTFHHKYAIFDGDKEACSEQTLLLTNHKSIDFPSDNSMLKDIARKLNEVIKYNYQKK